jgi:hypothetical protein
VIALLIAAAEPSKVPIYIAGSLFALWAVVLGWIGLNRPEFPYHVRGQRAVVGVSLTLAVVTVAMAIVSS